LKERLGKAAIETNIGNMTDQAAENGIRSVVKGRNKNKNRQSQ
jgi:hypothetical protein